MGFLAVLYRVIVGYFSTQLMRHSHDGPAAEEGKEIGGETHGRGRDMSGRSHVTRIPVGSARHNLMKYSSADQSDRECRQLPNLTIAPFNCSNYCKNDRWAEKENKQEGVSKECRMGDKARIRCQYRAQKYSNNDHNNQELSTYMHDVPAPRITSKLNEVANILISSVLAK